MPLTDATGLSRVTGVREEKIRRLTREGRVSYFLLGRYIRYNTGEAVEAIEMSRRKGTEKENRGGRESGNGNETNSSVATMQRDRNELKENPKLVDTVTLAAILSVKPHWVRRAVKEHGLPSFRYGNAYRFNVDDVLEFGKRAAREKIDGNANGEKR